MYNVFICARIVIFQRMKRRILWITHYYYYYYYYPHSQIIIIRCKYNVCIIIIYSNVYLILYSRNIDFKRKYYMTYLLRSSALRQYIIVMIEYHNIILHVGYTPLTKYKCIIYIHTIIVIHIFYKIRKTYYYYSIHVVHVADMRLINIKIFFQSRTHVYNFTSIKILLKTTCKGIIKMISFTCSHCGGFREITYYIMHTSWIWLIINLYSMCFNVWFTVS